MYYKMFLRYNLFLFLLLLCLCPCGAYAASAVSSVNAYQDGNNIVITYKLAEKSDITVSVSTDGGATYSSLKSVTGDVGTAVLPGTKRITWNVLADYNPFSSSNVRFKVETKRVYDSAGYVDLGLPSGTRWKDTNEGGNNSYYTYDVALKTFGTRLPTKAQVEELRSKCKWTMTSSGYKVTGPNGKFIYLPIMGFRKCSGSVSSVGTYGYFWTSIPRGAKYACSFGFNASNVRVGDLERCYGLSVRLVQE